MLDFLLTFLPILGLAHSVHLGPGTSCTENDPTRASSKRSSISNCRLSCERNQRASFKYLGQYFAFSLPPNLTSPCHLAFLPSVFLDLCPHPLSRWRQLLPVGSPRLRPSVRLLWTVSDLEGIITMSKEVTGRYGVAIQGLLLTFVQVDRHAYIDANVAMGEIPGLENKLGNQCSGLFLR
jgi:hypothetical protein